MVGKARQEKTAHKWSAQKSTCKVRVAEASMQIACSVCTKNMNRRAASPSSQSSLPFPRLTIECVDGFVRVRLRACISNSLRDHTRMNGSFLPGVKTTTH